MAAFLKKRRQGRWQREIAMTSWKTAAADNDDRLCELTTTEVLQSQLAPTMLSDSQILSGIDVGSQAGVAWRWWSGGDATGLSTS